MPPAPPVIIATKRARPRAQQWSNGCAQSACEWVRIPLGLVAFVLLSNLVRAAALPASWLDLAGKEVDPFQTNGSKATVFIFVKTDCPISNRYAPETRRLYEKFHNRGINFWLVHADADVSLEEIRQHAKEYQYPCGVLRDPAQALVQLCRARVTPEAAVFTPLKHLVYHGRIDDRFVALGQQRPDPTRHDLEEVLASVLAGKSVTHSSAPAVGCTIAPLPSQTGKGKS